MRRNDRAQDQAFSLELIDRCTHGVIAISTGEPAPYCLPLSFVRVGDSLYFHCAREGRKVDLLRRFPQVCVTFVGGDRPAFVRPAMYSTYFQSAIVTGTASEVEDPNERLQALRALCQKLTPEYADHFEAVTQQSLEAAAFWKVRIGGLSGKAKLELKD